MYSLHGLCNALSLIPHIELRVLTTDSSGPQRRQKLEITAFPVPVRESYKVYYCRRILGASFSPGLLARLLSMIQWADVVHLTAVYSSPTIPTLFLCKLFGKKVVWSPRGSFTEWSDGRKSRLKRLWNSVCDKLCERDRVVLHVTSEVEGEHARKNIPDATPVLIPNGVSLPESSETQNTANGKLRLLFLGRLHPIKGLENLFAAMVKVSNNVTLEVTGDGSGEYRTTLQRLVGSLGLGERVSFTGPVDEDSKASVFRKSDVCVLPSFSENFGMAIAESLAHGVPVIASKNTPWRQVESVGCGLWVANDPKQLAEAIEMIKTMPLTAMGAKGRAWMARDFSWERRGAEMLDCYRTLLRND